MVKFKKLLESKKISQWKDKYINYKSLKQIINEIYIKLETSKIFYLNQNNNQKYILNNDNYYYNRLNMDNKKVLNKFFNKLDTEIKLFYNGYISIERELFIRLNKFLSKKDLYKDMKFLIICNEIQEIYLFLVDTRLFSDYIFFNLEGIRKILKKFDKKLKKFYNNKNKILNYIRFLLEFNNSDLNYILQMKIIDEIILLSENLLNTLKKQINKIKNENNNYNNEDIINLNNEINNNKHDLNLLDNEIYIDALKKIEDSENNIKYNIDKIISNSYYRIVYINYGLYLNYESHQEDEKYIDPYIKNEEDFNYFRYIKQKEGNLILIKKFITNEGYNELIEENKKIISDFNKKNIYLILINVFLLNFFESNNLLIFIILFIKDNQFINNNKNFNQEFLICFSISLIYFGKIIGNVLSKFLLRKNKKFKFAILFEIIIIIFSHLLSIIWNENIINNKQIYNIFLSKFLFGLVSSEKIEKSYLINFLPKNTLYIYTKYFNKIKNIAKFIGFLFSIFIFWCSFFFNKNNLINNYYSFFLLISLIQFFIYYNKFKNTFNDDFSILIKNIETRYLLLNNDDNDLNSKNNNNNNIYDEMFTLNDEEKIKESNKKFESMNNLERFTELNLIPINIKNLINIYNSKLRKLYNILIYLNSLSIFIIVSFTIIFSITLFKNKITFFYLLIPFNYLIIDKVHYLFFSDNISKKNFITGLLHILLIIFIIIIMLFSLLPKILLLIFFSFIVIINLIIIKKIKRFISIVLPNNINLNYKFFESNTIIKFFGYISGIIGGIITFIILNLFNLKIEELDKGTNLFYYIYFIICGMLIFFGIWIYQWNFDIEKMKLFGRIIKRELYS